MLPKEALNICRLCLIKERVEINIFDNNSNELFRKMCTCLPITISLDDHLPKIICIGCHEKINMFYEFWNQVLNSEKHLLSWQECDPKLQITNDTENSEYSSVILEQKHNFLTECSNSREFNSDIKDDCHLTEFCSVHYLIQPQDNENNEIKDNNRNNLGIDNDANNVNKKYFTSVSEKTDRKLNENTFRINEDENPGNSNYQEDNFSPLKQLQGYTDELTNNSLSNLSKIFQVLNSPGEMMYMPSTNSTMEDTQCDKNECFSEADTESEHRCNICNKSFSCEDILAMHKLSQCTEEIQVTQNCNSCDETSMDTTKLFNHMKNQHNNSKFQCKDCGKCFLTKHHLKIHNSIHLDIKPFSCQKCGTAFRYKKTFETHIKIHANEKTLLDEQTYICNVCEQRFSTRNSYIHHARSHKTVTTKCKLMCFVCNQTFLSKRTLVNHLRTQCGEKTYVCNVCGKELLSKESFECHKLIHIDEKMLICKICNKKFSHRKYFVVHQRIHTGERPYKCVTCNKTFTQASTLIVHRRYHTGERPYKCSICSKGFVTRTIMLSHSKYHKGTSFSNT